MQSFLMPKAGGTYNCQCASKNLSHFGPVSAMDTEQRVTDTGTFISIWRLSLIDALNAKSTLRPLEDGPKRKCSIKVSNRRERGWGEREMK
jgi:hypothetical protein